MVEVAGDGVTIESDIGGLRVVCVTADEARGSGDCWARGCMGGNIGGSVVSIGAGGGVGVGMLRAVRLSSGS